MSVRILILAALTLQAACFPYRDIERPAISGSVVSAADGKPIGGAIVSDPRSPTYRATTASDGTFSLSPEKGWRMWIIIPQEPFSAADLEVTAPGYKKMTVAVHGWRGEGKLDGPLRLEPEER